MWEKREKTLYEISKKQHEIINIAIWSPKKPILHDIIKYISKGWKFVLLFGCFDESFSNPRSLSNWLLQRGPNVFFKANKISGRAIDFDA